VWEFGGGAGMGRRRERQVQRHSSSWAAIVMERWDRRRRARYLALDAPMIVGDRRSGAAGETRAALRGVVCDGVACRGDVVARNKNVLWRVSERPAVTRSPGHDWLQKTTGCVAVAT
jgi:hypothetical protein